MSVFSADQVEILESICEEPSFLAGAEELVTDTVSSPEFLELVHEHNEIQLRIEKELQKVRKTLLEMSAETWSALEARLNFYHDWEDAKSALVTIINECSRKIEKPKRGTQKNHRREYIGELAYFLFRHHGLEVDASRAGDFVEFLSVIIQALDKDWCPRAMSREVIKWRQRLVGSK